MATDKMVDLIKMLETADVSMKLSRKDVKKYIWEKYNLAFWDKQVELQKKVDETFNPKFEVSRTPKSLLKTVTMVKSFFEKNPKVKIIKGISERNQSTTYKYSIQAWIPGSYGKLVSINDIPVPDNEISVREKQYLKFRHEWTLLLKSRMDENTFNQRLTEALIQNKTNKESLDALIKKLTEI